MWQIILICIVIVVQFSIYGLLLEIRTDVSEIKKFQAKTARCIHDIADAVEYQAGYTPEDRR